MIYSKDKLKEIAKPHFKEGINKIYITSDGNVFHENAITYAMAHKKQNKLEIETFTTEDFQEEKKVLKVKKVEKEEKPKEVKDSKE